MGRIFGHWLCCLILFTCPTIWPSSLLFRHSTTTRCQRNADQRTASYHDVARAGSAATGCLSAIRFCRETKRFDGPFSRPAVKLQRTALNRAHGGVLADQLTQRKAPPPPSDGPLWLGAAARPTATRHHLSPAHDPSYSRCATRQGRRCFRRFPPSLPNGPSESSRSHRFPAPRARPTAARTRR